MIIKNDEKYLIVIDLGKTLLPDSENKYEWTISDIDFNAIRNCIEKGHEIVIATGRFESVAIEIYKHLKLNSYLILENGKLIYDNDLQLIHKDNAWGKWDAVEFIRNGRKVISFGDGEVDREMLEKSDLSFAMKNGHPELIKIYKCTSRDNNNSGVGITLNKLFK